MGIPVRHAGVMHDVDYLHKGTVAVATNDGIRDLLVGAVPLVYHDDEFACFVCVVPCGH